MAEHPPIILALDFDGVICDGLVEYFQTAWRAYTQIWAPAEPTPPPELAAQFYRLRPVVESGWEMPVLIRSLRTGISEAEIFANWGPIAAQQIEAIGLTAAAIAARVDHIRDEWIETNLEQWLAQHRFYPGIAERLRQMLADSVPLFIITTKEQRFVRQLLQQQQIDLPATQIFGKEVKRPKAETLQLLMQQFHDKTGRAAQIWFVEDRLKTLQAIQRQPHLDAIQLYLADWGYNTETDRQWARQDDRIQLLSLSQFVREFFQWRQ